MRECCIVGYIPIQHDFSTAFSTTCLSDHRSKQLSPGPNERMSGHVHVLHSLAGSELNRQITQHEHAFTYTNILHTRAKSSLTYGASKTDLGLRARTL